MHHPKALVPRSSSPRPKPRPQPRPERMTMTAPQLDWDLEVVAVEIGEQAAGRFEREH